MKKVYFPNLNGLRFIAALLVIISHIEQIKSIQGVENYLQNLPNIGSLGVTLFFVLSGFLITYLLLQENKETGSIDLRNFYIRRILRIWPLYYLIVFLGFFIFPHFITLKGWELNTYSESYVVQLLLHIFLLPNIALMMFQPVSFISQLWSVGVEEQFYLFWPLLIKFFTKHLKSLFVLVLVIFLALKYIPFRLSDRLGFEKFRMVGQFFQTFRVGCMAIGGLGAYFLFNDKKRFLKFIYRRDVQIAVISFTIISILFKISFHYVHDEVYSFFFAIMIVNAASNPKNIINLENRVFTFLGKISYGLYIYHPLAIAWSLSLIQKMIHFRNSLFQNFFLYSISFLLTIILSIISYCLLEIRFLKVKKRFSAIITGDNIRENDD